MVRVFEVVRDALRGARPRTILVVAWLFMVLYAYPGYMNWDSGDQLFQLRQRQYGDWHPPMMARYWRVIELVIHGPFGMLVLQTVLFLWGLFSIVKLRFEARTAAWITAALFLFPPVFTPMAAVWKDAQMAGFLIAGTALALRPGWRARIGGLVLLMMATGVRDNAAAALPHLMLWIAATWGCRPWIKKVAVGVGLFVCAVGTAALANRQLTDQRDFAWYKTTAIFDIAGTIAHAPRIPDAELYPLLKDTGLKVTDHLQTRVRKVYNPRVWFQLSFSEDAIFVTMPNKAERLARKAALKELIRRYPGAYASHRWAMTKQLLGLTEEPSWEPVCQSFAANQDHLDRVAHNHSYSWLQEKVGGAYRKHLGERIVYKPWAYVLLALVFLAYGLWRRDQMIVALTSSGLLYELSYVFMTAAPDFRYSHWLVTCVMLCAVFIFAERLRARRQPTTPVA
jgi:hypothetical protein